MYSTPHRHHWILIIFKSFIESSCFKISLHEPANQMFFKIPFRNTCLAVSCALFSVMKAGNLGEVSVRKKLERGVTFIHLQQKHQPSPLHGFTLSHFQFFILRFYCSIQRVISGLRVTVQNPEQIAIGDYLLTVICGVILFRLVSKNVYHFNNLQL